MADPYLESGCQSTTTLPSPPGGLGAAHQLLVPAAPLRVLRSIRRILLLHHQHQHPRILCPRDEHHCACRTLGLAPQRVHNPARRVDPLPQRHRRVNPIRTWSYSSGRKNAFWKDYLRQQYNPEWWGGYDFPSARLPFDFTFGDDRLPSSVPAQ